MREEEQENEALKLVPKAKAQIEPSGSAFGFSVPSPECLLFLTLCLM